MWQNGGVKAFKIGDGEIQELTDTASEALAGDDMVAMSASEPAQAMSRRTAAVPDTTLPPDSLEGGLCVPGTASDGVDPSMTQAPKLQQKRARRSGTVQQRF